jgi:hypothetical protein
MDEIAKIDRALDEVLVNLGEWSYDYRIGP